MKNKYQNVRNRIKKTRFYGFHIFHEQNNIVWKQIFEIIIGKETKEKK